MLIDAGVRDAASVIVALQRDDTAVLATLNARELAPEASIAASAAVARGSRVLRFDDPATERLEAGDRLVCLCSNR